LEAKKQTLQASIRAKVEHPFKVIKQVFGYNKVRYRGLLKNTERLITLAGFANLLRVQKALLD
jgi:IS5 family transposase